MNDNALDIVPSETLLHIVSFMDARTLLDFLSTSHRYKQLKYNENKTWKLLYAVKWCVEPLELDCYEKDWKIEFRNRCSGEKSLIEEIEAKKTIEEDESDPFLVFSEDDSLPVLLSSVVTFRSTSNPWYTLLTQSDSEGVTKAVQPLQALYDRGYSRDLKREVDEKRLEILLTAIRSNVLSAETLIGSLMVIYNYLFDFNFGMGSEVPIGYFSLMKDFLDMKFYKKQHLTDCGYTAYYQELFKLVKLLIQFECKFPASFWHTMNFVRRLMDLIKNEPHEPARLALMKILSIYCTSNEYCHFPADEQFIKAVLQCATNAMKDQNTEQFNHCKNLAMVLSKQYPDLCRNLGLVLEELNFVPTGQK